MPSAVYELIREAIQKEKQVTCLYKRMYREICPVVIGHAKGVEKLLAYQFGGETTSSRLPQWRCLFIAEISDVHLRDGPWYEGGGHQATQTCVTDVDIDVNIHIRKRR
jgi:predicted DNA-binding transcriptional regulator YafY